MLTLRVTRFVHYNPLLYTAVLPKFMSSANGFGTLRVPAGKALIGIYAELSPKVDILRCLLAPSWHFDVFLP